MIATESERFVTRQDTAARLGINVRTLDRLVDLHQLPRVKFGRAVRLPESSVQELIRKAGGSAA